MKPSSTSDTSATGAPRFTTIEQALDACEAAGLEPLHGPDHQCGTKYAVCLPNAERYINCYGDHQFLAWCNDYFRMVELRKYAGWTFTPPWGWCSPNGTPEQEWALNERPFPEDSDFAEWFEAAHHYDALDEGVEVTPYPFAPARASKQP